MVTRIQSIMGKAAGLWRDRRGGTAIMFALAAPVLIGGLATGFEVSNWYMTQRGMQNAADAAALAAASNGSDNFDVEGKAVAAQLGFTDGDGNTTVTLTQSVQGNAGSPSYIATVTTTVPLYLSPIVGFVGDGNGNQTLTATSTATIGTTQRSYCVLALANNGNATAIRTSGNPQANLTGCNIKSNTNALCTGSNLGAEIGDAVGTNTGCGKVMNSGVAASVDPYSDLSANIPTNTCNGAYPGTHWSGTKNLSGDVKICGRLSLTGNVTVNAPNGATVTIYNGPLDGNGYRIQTSSGSGLTIV